MAEFVFQFSMPLVMTQWVTKRVQRDGVLYNLWRKFYCQLLACWQV
jgi:hypothetical protein